MKHSNLDFIKNLGRWQKIYMTAISNGILSTPVFVSPLSFCFLSLLSFLHFPMLSSYCFTPILFPSNLESSLVMPLVCLHLPKLSLSSMFLVYQGVFLNKDISFSQGNTSTNFQDNFNIIGGWSDFDFFLILISIVLLVSNSSPTLFN